MALSKEQVIAELYKRGNLQYKLDTTQKQLYDLYKNGKERINVWLCSRRLGKSFTLVVIAIEECLRTPNAIVNYLAPTKLQLQSTICQELVTKILEDCPEQFKPVFNKHQYTYTFHNGSRLRLAGADSGHAEKLRGGNSTVAFIDEAGSIDNLNYIVKSILVPTTSLTKGKIILASTPPKNSEHDFLSFIASADANGSLVKKTVYDNPRLTQEEIEQEALLVGGKHTEDFRREYLCELVKSEETSVIPEFTESLEKEIVREWPTPPYFDCYEAMDLGYQDLTAVIFYYYDFRANKLIIEDELVIDFSKQENNLPKLIKEIQRIEQERWYNPISGEVRQVYKRVSDINPLVTQEIARASNGKIAFFNADKSDFNGNIHTLRVMLASKQIIINPRCKNLIRHLRHVRWKNGDKKTFAHSAENGHFDLCFTAGNKVLTKSGYKNIEDVRVGDEVLTHLGRFRKVLNTMSKDYIGPITKIKPAGRNEITCTPNHPFFVGEFKREHSQGFTGQLIHQKDSWITADQLSNKHKLFIPSYPENSVNISNEMAFLYGYWVAEGSLGGNGYQVQFAGHQREVNVLKILEKAIYDKYGRGCVGISRKSLRRHKLGTCKPRSRKLRIRNIKNSNTRNILLTQKELWDELKLLGKSTYKRFPDWYTELNSTQSKYMLAGYLFGDAHFSPTGIVASSISEEVIRAVDHLARKSNLIGNVRFERKRIQKSVVNGREVISRNDKYIYNLEKEQTQTFLDFINSEKLLYFTFQDKLVHPIKLKHKSHYPNNYTKYKKFSSEMLFVGKVYNLEVEEDHSYTVSDIAVHNCMALAYGVKAVNYNKNPYPAHYDMNMKDLYVVNPSKFHSQGKQIDAFKKIFGVRRK